MLIRRHMGRMHRVSASVGGGAWGKGGGEAGGWRGELQAGQGREGRGDRWGTVKAACRPNHARPPAHPSMHTPA